MTPTNKEVRTALEKVLNSQSFAHSERHKSFLRYIVEETIEGRGNRIKGYSIAVEVFGKAADFDAQNDPYVRVEAGRLRKRLTDYYHSEGANDALRIVIKKGSYTPVFEFVDASRPASDIRATSSHPSVARRLWSPVLGLSLVAVGLIAFSLWLSTDSTEDESFSALDSALSLRVSTFEVSGGADIEEFAEGLVESVIEKLDRHQSVWGPIDVFRVDDLAALGIDDSQDYLLNGAVSLNGESIHVTASLVDASDGRRLWTRSFAEDFAPSEFASIRDRVSTPIANAVREPFGPIADAEVQKLVGRPVETLSEYQCHVLFLHAVDKLSRTTRSDARRCLERHDLLGELDATGLGALSFLYYLDHSDGVDFVTGQAPLTLAAYNAAQRALNLNANDLLAQMAMAFVNLERHAYGEARQALAQLMNLNPPKSTFGIAGLLSVKLGDQDQAASFLEVALNEEGRATPSLFLGATIFHLNSGDYVKALEFADRIDAPEFTMMQVLSAALAAHVGDMRRANLHVEQIERMHLEFSAYGRELIDRWALPPAAVANLLAGLEIAGIDLQ